MKLFKKRSKLEKFYYANKEFIDYNIVSFISTIILYIVFFIVDKVTNGNYLLANFISYTVSFTVLYILDREVFDAKPRTRRTKAAQLTTFIVVRVIGFPLDSLVLTFLIKYFKLGNFAAKIIGSFIMFIYNY